MVNLDKKRKIIEDLLSHLDTSQGGDLAKMIEEAKAPKIASVEKIDILKPKEGLLGESPEEEKMEGEMEGAAPIESMGDSHELGEKMDALASKDDDEKLSDEELAEMLKQYLGQ